MSCGCTNHLCTNTLTCVVVVHLLPPLRFRNVNEPPVPSAASYTFSVTENTGAGGAVGTLTASDPDALSTLSWTVSVWGPGAAMAFVLNAQGFLTVLIPPNYEAQSSYALTAVVSDGLVSVARAVTVNVLNVNEAPVLDSATYVLPPPPPPCPALSGVTSFLVCA